MTNDTINPSRIKRLGENICHPHNGIQITKNCQEISKNKIKLQQKKSKSEWTSHNLQKNKI